ncbi:hypothetical protein EXU48_01650 [Occultella glacieicola]|uniref:HIT domain-containing protein n=1 Tax=Occultella glacieicola TaxID=2518684 RepID=A0ABY2E8U2_9MICO|nr:hypothetical protein [Occultella glacieicola]TDE98925.1 hypothetical protein EXU48_01650 [Occultella glacieicola]
MSATIEATGYRELGWADWPSWPFEGELRPRAIVEPAEEPTRQGAGGADCFMCAAAAHLDPSYVIWHDEHAFLGVPQAAQSLPFGAFLMPRAHADLRDLRPATAARMGELLTAIERAACDVLDVPRIQVARWGDGQEHLHWWLFARPTGMLQLRGTFLSHWGDMLPTRDREAARADLDLVAARLVDLTGGHAVPAG